MRPRHPPAARQQLDCAGGDKYSLHRRAPAVGAGRRAVRAFPLRSRSVGALPSPCSLRSRALPRRAVPSAALTARERPAGE